MKTLLLAMSALALLAVASGCEDEHHHHHGPYGGAYDGTYRGYGHGDWDDYRGPYQGYPNYGYPHH